MHVDAARRSSKVGVTSGGTIRIRVLCSLIEVWSVCLIQISTFTKDGGMDGAVPPSVVIPRPLPAWTSLIGKITRLVWSEPLCGHRNRSLVLKSHINGNRVRSPETPKLAARELPAPNSKWSQFLDSFDGISGPSSTKTTPQCELSVDSGERESGTGISVCSSVRSRWRATSDRYLVAQLAI